jgi:hypothetical protein
LSRHTYLLPDPVSLSFTSHLVALASSELLRFSDGTVPIKYAWKWGFASLWKVRSDVVPVQISGKIFSTFVLFFILFMQLIDFIFITNFPVSFASSSLPFFDGMTHFT